ncbi:MAG: biotin--[acetyl-CoA-carboxylase] ligase [Planctomycetota bacterium]
MSQAGASSGPLQAADVRAARARGCPAWSEAPLEVHETIGSTNDRARELGEAGVPEGALVVAARQEQGRGRLGRTWASPEGGLYLSLVLRPDESMLRRLPATLLGGLAVAQALEDHGAKPELKWPNDVLLGGRKVAGILGELGRDEQGQRLVLGVGINVSTPQSGLPAEVPATSLALATGSAPPLSEVLASFLGHFAGHYAAIRRGGGATILAMASARMPLLGKPIQVRLGPDKVVTGVASGLSATGGLVLEHEDGQRREVLLAGEVEGVAPR